MTRMMYGGILALAIALATTAASASSDREFIRASIDHFARIPDSVNDPVRKPDQVIEFSTIMPGQSVAEFVPGEGYYTRLLSQVVGSSAHVYSVVPRFGSTALPTARTDSAEIQLERVTGRAEVAAAFNVANVTSYNNVSVLGVPIDQFGGANFPLPEQVDAVFTYGGYHDLYTLRFSVPTNTKLLDVAAINRAIFDAIEPGGVFVIIDAASRPGAGIMDVATLGRIDKAQVVADVTAAGFTLEAESDALENPADNYREAAAGMTSPDQFMLRFRKPLNSPTDLRRSDSEMSNLFDNTIVYWNSCEPGPNGQVPICGIEATEHHLRYRANRTFQVDGLPGDDPLIQGRWFFDSRGHSCQWGENPGRGGVMCHTLHHAGAKVGDSWIAHSHGAANMSAHALLVEGNLKEFGTLTEADFPITRVEGR